MACAPAKPPTQPSDEAAWNTAEPPSKKTLRIGELALATGVSASAFGGLSMGVGKAIGEQDPGGQVTFWIGVGTLGMGIVSTAVALVVLGVAGIQYASGN
jgi:hypothetical protein